MAAGPAAAAAVAASASASVAVAVAVAVAGVSVAAGGGGAAAARAASGLVQFDRGQGKLLAGAPSNGRAYLRIQAELHHNNQ